MKSNKALNALMMMASALPAIGHTEGVPQQTTIMFKQLNYLDYQKDSSRIHVTAPMAVINTALSDNLEFNANIVTDSVSGASPKRIHTLSGASGKGITEYRKSIDTKLTYYSGHVAVGLGASVSSEHDYLSKSISLDTRISSENKNTTYAFGISSTDDSISKTGDPDLHEKKRSKTFFTGVTQVLSPVMVVQSNLAYTEGHGYYNDVYKNFENRPTTKYETAWLNRLNYYVIDYDTALHLDYRYARNSWGVRSNMIEASAYKSIGNGWILRPSIRSYSQSQANFFSNDAGTLIDKQLNNEFMSADERLGSYGSLTLGLKAIKKLDDNTSLDISFDYYQQKNALKWGGNGTPDFTPFYAKFLMFGITHKF